LGEYQVLTAAERAEVVRAAIEAAPPGFPVVPGVGAYGAAESARWAAQAQAAGAKAVLALPPNAYLASDDEVVAHYREVAAVGLPVVAYNNPFDTKVDLGPELIGRLAGIDGIVAVKEFSGDIRRVTRIRDMAPEIDVLAGTDDLIVEALLMGAVGWIGGFPNAIPHHCAELYRLAITGDAVGARALYSELHDSLAWDSKHTFVQAIKLSMDIVGRYGGVCRPPRGALTGADEVAVRRDMARALAAQLPAAASV
jgi:4-hydroxy-tetrahydrodipicolinate synthase